MQQEAAAVEEEAGGAAEKEPESVAKVVSHRQAWQGGATLCARGCVEFQRGQFIF